MKKKRKLRIKIFYENRCKKIMRHLQRKNKRKRKLVRFNQNFSYPNKVFTLLQKKKFGKTYKPLSILREKVHIKIPIRFSISENTDETLKTLKELFYYGSKLTVKEIDIDHSSCIELEIAASTVMDVIVLAIREYHRKYNSEITFCGTFPTTGRVKDVFIASGLGEHLNLKFSDIPINLDKMELFKIQTGYHKSYRSDSTSTSLAEYIIRCLNKQGYTLTFSGRNLLLHLFGEILDNCDIHGGSDSTWFALGHYQEQDNHSYGELQLVIFNFGNTIYEQMNSINTTEETKCKLSYLLEKHKKYFSSTWTEEMLFTLFSLQEGISRLRNQQVEGNRKRGTGTIRLIENFQKIGQTINKRNPLMTITSGSTHIRFDNKYMLEKVKFNDTILGDQARSIIAFNKENDIFLPPDPNNVQRLREFFPGTIISLNFFFDKRYLESIVHKENNHGKI